MARATRVAVLVNPTDAAIADVTARDVETAARAVGMQIQVLNARTSRGLRKPSASLFILGQTIGVCCILTTVLTHLLVRAQKKAKISVSQLAVGR